MRCLGGEGAAAVERSHLLLVRSPQDRMPSRLNAEPWVLVMRDNIKALLAWNDIAD